MREAARLECCARGKKWAPIAVCGYVHWCAS